MEKLHYVYGLYSTRFQKNNYPERIKYIGRTDNPTVRLTSHINSAKNGKLSPLYEWIRKEIDKGGEIKITLLHQCSKDEIIECEKRLIKENKHKKLLNIDHNDSFNPTELYKRNKQLSGENHKLREEITKLVGGRSVKDELKSLKTQIRDLEDKNTSLMLYLNKLEQYVLDNGLKPPRNMRP
jgi:hypothetical protein